MAGLLDQLYSMDNVSPWGALYRVPQEVQGQNDRLKALLEAGAGAGLPVDLPANLVAQSAFPDMPRAAAPAPLPPPTAFSGGAVPFAFGGPAANLGPDLSRFQPQPPAAPAPAPVSAPAPAAAPAPVPLPMPRPASAPGPVPVAAGPDAEGPDGGNLPRGAQAVQQPGMLPQQAPFGFGDRLSKGLMGFLGNLDAGPIGAILGGVGALATGRSTDPSSILAERQNATAQALLAKGVPPADVQAAINSPEVMRAVLQQFYGKDKYSIAQTGENENGKQYSVFNSNDGTFRPITVASDPNEAGGTIIGPNGKPITIPPGVNRKKFIEHVTTAMADAAVGKKTETQAKDSNYAAIMENAERQLQGLQNEGLSLWGAATSNIPVLGNMIQSENYQKYKQAQSAFITALLRQQSGATIHDSEFTRYQREYFPQPGDTPDVIAQKQRQREIAIDQMRQSAGPGYKGPSVNSGVTQSGLKWSVQ